MLEVFKIDFMFLVEKALKNEKGKHHTHTHTGGIHGMREPKDLGGIS